MKLSDVRILVIGDRVWATGKTLNEAVEKAKTIGGKASVKKYIAYLVQEGTKVDGMCWFYPDEDSKPVEFHRVGFPKEKKAKKEKVSQPR